MGIWQKIMVVGAVSVMNIAAYTPPSAAVNQLNKYRGYSELTSAATGMDLDVYTYNLTTWQMDHGGFSKAFADKYKNPWDGSASKSAWQANGKDLGTIDNDATVQEMILLALRYKATSNNTYKTTFRNSFRKALDFIFAAQYSSGGWPQVYPARGNYSDMVTFNDNAMVRLMVILKDILDGRAPFDSDIASTVQIGQIQTALDRAIEYIIAAQIVNNGIPTVWCAQHNPTTYAPEAARAYELKSKSGSESAGVVWFLMNWPDQNTAVQKAVTSALNWYATTKVSGLKYNKGTFESSPGASMWYRFYEVNNNNFFFCDRDGESSKTTDIMQISEERRTGYQWAGDYGSALLNAQSAYLSAISSLSSSSATHPISSSSSAAISSSAASPSSSSTLSSSSIMVAPEIALCGAQVCSNLIEGEDFCEAVGVYEDKNAGFMGRGYVNVDNEIGSKTSYLLKVKQALTTTIYLRYANAGATTRNGKITFGSRVLVADVEFPSTEAWTNWEILPITVEFPIETNYLELTSLTGDGLPNLDWIGFIDPAIQVMASCDIPVTISASPVTSAAQVSFNGVQIQWQGVAHGSALTLKNLNGAVVAQLTVANSGQAPLALPRGLYIVELNQNSTHQRWVIPHR